MKKILKLSLLAAIAAVSVNTAAFAASFSDMPEDAVMRGALENAVENKLLNGYENGEIRPDGNITRAEMSAIITRCLGAQKTADISGFKDVSKDEWYYDVLSKGVAMGAFKGDGSNLNPDSFITMQETFAVVSRIFDLTEMDENAIAGLTDKDKIDDWAKEYVVKVFTGGYWNGTELHPNDYITRGEFAILMDRLVQIYVNEPGTYKELADGNVVIRTDGAVFENVTNTKKIIIGDGVTGDTKFTDSDLNVISVRGGTFIPDNTGITLIRLIVEGTTANVATAKPKAKEKYYYGIKGTYYTGGTITLK